MSEATIKYDFSNIDEAVDDVVNQFLSTDNEENIKSANDFFKTSMEYGWD